jgi:hypothetical protein
MKLSCALVACNENPHYLAFWPVVKRAWWEIVGIPCIMVYIGNELPPSLQGDPAVILFKPIPGWPTATQAQCIRLLYPALLSGNGGVIVSDMDILPLQKDFFVDTIKEARDDQFVSYRETIGDEMIMCYVTARPSVWSELFQIQCLDDIYKRFEQWSHENPADGAHGGKGWCSDQKILFKQVMMFQKNLPNRVVIYPCPYKHVCPRPDRLDRCKPYEWVVFGETTRANLDKQVYVDFHMPSYAQCKDHVDIILDYAINAKDAIKHHDSPHDYQCR